MAKTRFYSKAKFNTSDWSAMNQLEQGSYDQK